MQQYQIVVYSQYLRYPQHENVNAMRSFHQSVFLEIAGGLEDCKACEIKTACTLGGGIKTVCIIE